MNWVEYRRKLLGRIGEAGQTTLDTVKDYKTLLAATTGNPDAKAHELVAPAVAVATCCDSCITVHAAEAIKHGAVYEEIADTLSVVISPNAGTALMYFMRVLGAVQTYEEA